MNNRNYTIQSVVKHENFELCLFFEVFLIDMPEFYLSWKIKIMIKKLTMYWNVIISELVCFLRESVELARNSLETLSYINRLFTVSHWVKQTSKGARFVAKVEALAGLQRKFTWYLFNNKWLLDKYILWQLWSFALGSYIYSSPSFVGVVRLLPLFTVFLFNLRCSPDYILFTQYFSIFRQGDDIMMMLSELSVKCTK